MNNFQFIPYTLIAVGLINAVYRHNDSNSVNMSVVLVLFGLLLFLGSRISGIKKFLEKQVVRVLVLVISALLIGLTLIK